MKQLLLVFIFTSCSFFTQINAQIIDFELLRQESLDDVQLILNEFGVPPSLINTRFPVDMYRVRYFTTHPANQELVEASGALIIPRNTNCPTPLVSYQHGTVARKTDVPSFNSSEADIGKVFASCGYVVCLPDYIGLGTSPGLHPYVHAKSQADAALDLMRAARILSDSLSYSLNDQLFLFGYSQGGHATMALHKEIEENFAEEFTVTASAPMSGPYDLSDVQAQVLVADSAYATPGYLPYVVLAYQSVYGNFYDDVSEIFISPYDETIPPLFDGTYSMGFINSQVPSIPNQILVPEQLDDFINNPENPLRLALQDNDVYDWLPQAPMRIMYCQGDDQVIYLNSVKAYNTFVSNGATEIEQFNFGNFDHGGCVQFCLLSAYAFFRDRTDAGNGMTASFDISPASSSGAGNGSASVNITGGTPPYAFEWFNGSDASSLTGLNPGNFPVTITDALGCSITATAQVGNLTSVADIEKLELNIHPNPAEHNVLIKLPEAGDLTIYNADGKLRYIGRIQHEQQAIIALHSFESGYFIVDFVGQSGKRLRSGFIKR
jgi:pimeloyl-ACP methyl ester carboxylesterase